MQLIRPALVMLVLMTLLTGLIYPLGMTALAQALFPHKAGGSLVLRDGKVIGSELIGQTFKSDGYFHGRPSPAGYDAANSTGSNLSPASKKLRDRVVQDAARFHAENPSASVPADLVTASASGLDPDISPAGALFQVPRVAHARHLDQAVLTRLVKAHVEDRLLGLIGEPHVNVLRLNMALDAYMASMRAARNAGKIAPG